MTQRFYLATIRYTATILVLTLGLSAPGEAQDEPRFYAEFSLGQSLLGEDSLTAEASSLLMGDAEVDYDTGFAGGFAFGWRPSPGWRLEAEYLYRTDELEFALFSDGTRFTEGDFSSVVISLNAYYDFRLWASDTSDRAFYAYVGAGLGWIQEVDIDLERAGEEIEFETDDSGYQWMLGLDFQFSERWNASFEFRVFEASDVRMESPEGAVVSDYTPANIMLSLGYRF